MAEQTKKYKLVAESIEDACEELEQYFASHRAVKKEYLRTRYLFEETLLNYQDKFGSEIEFEIRKSTRITKACVQLIVYSDKYNPFAADDEIGLLSSMIAASSKQHPNWQYVKSEFEWFFNEEGRGRNEIVFDVPREQKTSTPARIAIGFVFGIVIALILKLTLGAETCAVFAAGYILPLANAYTNVLSVMAIVMIFFSLPLCIVCYNNASEFHHATRKIISIYLRFTVLLVLVSALVFSLLYGIEGGYTGGSDVFKAIFNVIIGFVPGNIFAPFLNFDCMQVLIIGLMFGFSCLAMGERSKPLVDVFDRINLCAVLTNNFLAKFVSIYVALMMCSLIFTSSLEVLRKYIGMIVIIILGAVCCLVVATLAVCFKYKISIKHLIKKLYGSFIINLSSASVGASFIDLFNELAGGGGVEINFTAMACNIGTVLYKPMYALFLVGSALTAANLSGGISLKILVEVIFLSIVLPITIPNIPSGAASVIVIFISQLGLGNEYAEVFVSINAILQYIFVPVNIYFMQCIILLCAGSEDKLDLNKLRS